eukprot:scaffold212209_cov30-Tisochrysis_lutea.AAC.1
MSLSSSSESARLITSCQVCCCSSRGRLKRSACCSALRRLMDGCVCSGLESSQRSTMSMPDCNLTIPLRSLVSAWEGAGEREGVRPVWSAVGCGGTARCSNLVRGV